MRLAIVNNQRAAASPGLNGACPSCGNPVIARCGTQRVHHWAHRGARVCDHWWEPETEWHRAWKLKFPEAWQETILHDAAGEKHIADVRTDQGLTIEFQHSHIRPEERTARETFYGDMVWVVDGTRLQRDLPRFREGRRALRPVVATGVFTHSFPEELFPRCWLDSKAPVFFDFAGSSSNADTLFSVERSLWCLLPRTDQDAIVLKISREAFVRLARQRPQSLLFRTVPAILEQWLAAERARRVRQLLRHRASAWKAPHPHRRYTKRRRRKTY